jgi:hypothetical protein
MGTIFSVDIQTIHFEQLNKILKDQNILLINTLPINEQNCLIDKTIQGNSEQNIISSSNKDNSIIIYGRNHNDKTPYTKYTQLKKLGYTNVSVYSGGLCEWVLLSEYFGRMHFKLTNDCKDLLTLI